MDDVSRICSKIAEVRIAYARRIKEMEIEKRQRMDATEFLKNTGIYGTNNGTETDRGAEPEAVLAF